VHRDAEIAGDRLQRQALHGAGAERLADRERPVLEAALGREQLDAHAVAGQRSERQDRLQAGDAAAGHEHPGRFLQHGLDRTPGAAAWDRGRAVQRLRVSRRP
jgi:hypothetical protein